MPDHERAETYLRLQAEAELRRALAMPEYKPPRERRPSSSSPLPLTRAACGAAARSWIGSCGSKPAAQVRLAARRHGPANQPERSARSLLAALQRTATSSLSCGALGRWPGRAATTPIGESRGIPAHRSATLPGICADACAGGFPGGFAAEVMSPPAQACVERVGALAGVLAAVGAISAQTETDVVADFTFALAARSRIEPDALLGDGWFPATARIGAGTRTARSGRPADALPVGVFANGEVEGVPVRFYLGVLVFDQGSAALTMQARFPAESFEHDHRHRDPMFDALSDVRAVDDRGGTYQAHFSGGGGDGKWDGRLHLMAAPPAGVRWLDMTLPGAPVVRIPMDTPAADLRVTTEAVTTTAADRLLDAQTAQLLLASATDAAEFLAGDDTPNVFGMAADLLAAGVVTTSSESLRRLAEAAAHFGVRLPGSLAAIEPADLPADWLSLRARADRDRRDRLASSLSLPSCPR